MSEPWTYRTYGLLVRVKPRHQCPKCKRFTRKGLSSHIRVCDHCVAVWFTGPWLVDDTPLGPRVSNGSTGWLEDSKDSAVAWAEKMNAKTRKDGEK